MAIPSIPGLHYTKTAEENTAAWTEWYNDALLAQDEQELRQNSHFRIPHGEILLDGAVHKIPPGYKVYGAGRDLTTLKFTGDVPSPNTFLQLLDNCALRDLTVDCDSQDGNGVSIFEAKHCLVDNVRVKNCADYAFWVIDFAGQATRSGVQYGHSTISNCIAEGREGFEAFYVEEVNFENCFCVGLPASGGAGPNAGTAAQNGYIIRDESTGIRLTNCHATGTFTGNALKYTNNDAKTLHDGTVAITGCRLENASTNTASYCAYFLDLANVRVENTTLRATNDCSGLFFGVTSTSRQECRSNLELDIECAGAGTPVRLSRGSGITIRGRAKTGSAQYLLEVGTNGSITSDNTISMDLEMDSTNGAPRAVKFNDCSDFTFRESKFLGDGTAFQMSSLGAAATANKVRFYNCHMRSARINQVHGDDWVINGCQFSNPNSAAIASGGYIHCNGSNVDRYTITGNNWTEENGSTVFLFDDTAATTRVHTNMDWPDSMDVDQPTVPILVNEVTAGGTSNTVSNWNDLSTYSNDAGAIRNAIYQLARKLDQVLDGLHPGALNLFLASNSIQASSGVDATALATALATATMRDGAGDVNGTAVAVAAALRKLVGAGDATATALATAAGLKKAIGAANASATALAVAAITLRAAGAGDASATALATAAGLRKATGAASVLATALATGDGVIAADLQGAGDILATALATAAGLRKAAGDAAVLATALSSSSATTRTQGAGAILATALAVSAAVRKVVGAGAVSSTALATAANTLRTQGAGAILSTALLAADGTVSGTFQGAGDILATALAVAAGLRTTDGVGAILATALATAGATARTQGTADAAATALAVAAAIRKAVGAGDVTADAQVTGAVTYTAQALADASATALAVAAGLRKIIGAGDVSATALAVAAGIKKNQGVGDVSATALAVADVTYLAQAAGDVSATALAVAAGLRSAVGAGDVNSTALVVAAATIAVTVPTPAWEMDFSVPPTQEIHATASAVAAACSSGASPFAIWITDGTTGDVVDDVGTLDMTPSNSPLRDRVATGLFDGTDANSYKTIEFAASTNLIRTAAHTNFSLDADCAFAFPYRWGAYTGSNAQVFSTRTTNGEGIWVRGIGTSLIVAVTNGASQTGTVNLTTEGINGSWDFVVVMWDASAKVLYAYLASDTGGGSASRPGTVTSALSTVTTVGGGYYASFIGQIPFIYAWTGAEAAKIVDYDDVAGLWTHGGDPSALLSTAKLNGNITCPVGFDATYGTYLATYRGDGTHGVDQLPWMHHESASDGGLLALRSLTNLLTYSQNFSLWTSTDCTTQIGNDKSPMGTRTATKVTATGSNSRTRLAATVANGTIYYLSIYARTITGTATSRLAIYDSADTTEKTGGDISVTTVWQRFEIPWTSDTTGTVNPQIQAGVRGSASGEIIQIFGAMLCTIPDAPIVYTRAATASMTGTDYRYASAPFNLDDEGMVRAKFSLLTDDNGEDHFIWKRGGSSDSLYARLDSAENMDVGLNDSTPTLTEATNSFASLDLTTLIDFWARWHVTSGGISDSSTANEALDIVRAATSQDSAGTPVITVGSGAADFHVGQDDSAANNLDGIVNYIAAFSTEADIGDLPA